MEKQLKNETVYYYINLLPEDKERIIYNDLYDCEGDFLRVRMTPDFARENNLKVDFDFDGNALFEIFACCDENVLREMVTGKPLITWENANTDNDAIFYAYLIKMTEGFQIDGMVEKLSFLDNNEEYKKRYIEALNRKLNSFKPYILSERPSQKSLNYLASRNKK